MQQRVSKVLSTKSQFWNRSLYSIRMQSVSLRSLPVNVMKMFEMSLADKSVPEDGVVKIEVENS